jgi:hypothetical protein
MKAYNDSTGLHDANQSITVRIESALLTIDRLQMLSVSHTTSGKSALVMSFRAKRGISLWSRSKKREIPRFARNDTKRGVNSANRIDCNSPVRAAWGIQFATDRRKSFRGGALLIECPRLPTSVRRDVRSAKRNGDKNLPALRRRERRPVRCLLFLRRPFGRPRTLVGFAPSCHSYRRKPGRRAGMAA